MSATKNQHRCIRTKIEIANHTYARCVNHTSTGQCFGSMTFWCGSGYMSLTNESGSCYFRHWPSKRQQKTNLKKKFLLITFWRYITSFYKDKSPKEVTKQWESKFFLLFFLDVEGSGSRSIPLTNGSGSGSRRPKNIRIRIRNTATRHPQQYVPTVPTPQVTKQNAARILHSSVVDSRLFD